MNKSNNTFYKSIPFRLKYAYNSRFLLEHFLGFRPFLPIFRKWADKTKLELEKHLESYEEQIIQVPIIDANMNPNDIQNNFVKKGLPFVMRNGAQNWDAYKKWDFNFFKEEYGNHPVLLTYHKALGDNEEQPEETNLSNIIDGLEENSMKYVRFNPLLDTYPHLQDELNQDWLSKVRDTKIKKHHVLFIGNKGTKTNIHNAGNENIFVHMRGTKKWFLWDQRANPILNPDVNRAPAKSSVYSPYDLNSEQAFSKIPRYEVTCSAGDIIYIPSYLWHFVYNETPTIGVGIRWLSPKRTIANCSLFAFLEIFNTSPSLFHTMDWRKGFDFNRIMMKNMKKRT